MGKRTDPRPYRPVRLGEGRRTNLNRRVDTREPTYSVLVTTNGESTEVAYIEALLRADFVSPQVGRRKVKFFRQAPADLLRVSIGELHRLGYDHLYSVADVDEFPCDSIARAVDDYTGKRARLIVCNPCFEAWLLLHFELCRSHLSNADQAKARLKRHVPGYDKTHLDFTDYALYIDDATERAKSVEDPLAVNPASSMWILVEGLRDPAKHEESLRCPP